MSNIFNWLDKASKSNLPEVQAAAKVMKDYYEGASRDPSPIKTWQDRQAESTEEWNDMPPPKWHFMEQELMDYRAKYAGEPLDHSLLQKS